MNTLHIRRQLIVDKHLNGVDYTNGSELNSAITAAMQEYEDEVINKNAVLRNVNVPKGTLCECGRAADGTLYGKPIYSSHPQDVQSKPLPSHAVYCMLWWRSERFNAPQRTGAAVRGV